MRCRAIFLDRDGVLNKAIIKSGKPYPPSTIREFAIAEEAGSALSLLKKLGFLLVGATNQPDVARGSTSQEFVETLHDELMKALPLDEMYVCYHDDKHDCACRKPRPGLLLQAAFDFDIELPLSVMIGDRWKDIEAGQRAGCKTIWINQGYDEPKPKQAPDFVAKNLLEAAYWIRSNLT